MTIIIKLTEEDMYNATRIGAEIDPSIPASIVDVSHNHYTIDTGAIKIDIVSKICTLDVDSKFLSYLTGSILDIVSMFKMMGRFIIRMLDESFFNDKIIITKNGKPINDIDADPAAAHGECNVYNV